VNCGALAEGVLRASCSPPQGGIYRSTADRAGLFEAAEGGTVFLDEIGETSPTMQVKLAARAAGKRDHASGDSQSRTVDVRVIAATNRDLEEEVRNGRFREDLYYRLSVFPIALPPLRERREDIPLLAQHFLAELTVADGQGIGVSPRRPWRL